MKTAWQFIRSTFLPEPGPQYRLIRVLDRVFFVWLVVAGAVVAGQVIRAALHYSHWAWMVQR